ncbi:MAG: redoxin domain-containing protein [bacterium]|nr:redoxin domain-containing protein [bacterium]
MRPSRHAATCLLTGALALAGCYSPRFVGEREQPKMAPEIEGVDFDGTRFRLSDYRGKVVMLDFWGHW